MAKLSEAEVTKQIRYVLKLSKVWHYKHWQGPMSTKGVADIIGIYDGRFLAIEIKMQGWKPPAPGTKQYKHYREQCEFLEEVERNGGIGFFVKSVDEVIERLDLKCKVIPMFANNQTRR